MALETNLSGFDIAEVRENESGYNYYGFCKADGSWRILRVKTDDTEYRLAVGGSEFEAAFTSRASLNYKTANHLPRV
jgi:hypothetical protein